ncbi:MAG: hypothetical protein EA378_05140 [Phycisphaerales bacterium]|nr:MAG: hypothetical protein EA378_05140 [Phycisphaerales bacterium]
MTSAAPRTTLYQPRFRRSAIGGFTIIEILVVFVIIAILTAVGVPAVRAVLRSTDRAGAVNQLRVAIAAARDAALRAEPGRDAAAVFFFEPGGQFRIVVCEQVGTMQDRNLNPSNPPVAYVPDAGSIFRDLFVPLPTFEPVTLSSTWSVRGYAAPGVPDRIWYQHTYGDLPQAATEAQWVFPETGFFFDPTTSSTDNGARGPRRQTFMIRFAGGSGEPVLIGGNEALVVDPSPVSGFRSQSPFNQNNLAQAGDLRRAVTRILNSPRISREDRQRLLGDESSDTILTRPVPQLILYDRAEMAAFLGIRLDRETNALYRPVRGVNGVPALLTNPGQTRELNEWIEGRTGNDRNALASGGRLFTLNRTSGSLSEVLP